MTRIYVLTPDGVTETANVDEARKTAKENNGIVWVDVRAFNEEEFCRIAEEFNLHSLEIESVFDAYSRPHLFEYEDHFHVNFTYIELTQNSEQRPLEFHVFLSGDYIITASENGGGTLVDRVVNNYNDTPSMVERGTYHALYQLVDLLTDTYLEVAEALDNQVDALEDKMLNQADQSTLQQLFHLKRNLFDLRRYLGPQRDVYNELARRQFKFVDESYQMYFQDVYNRMIRVFDVTDTARDIISGTFDIYQSTIANRLNDIMKVLTIFAVILGILTLVTGFFGMNFAYLPGLQSRYAPVGLSIAMLGLILVMIIYFRRKKWL